MDLVKPDIIGITEVWQKEEFNIQGYHQAFRKDREDGKVGGGVLLLVKDCWQVLECPELMDADVECVWCIIKFTRQDSILVGVCYRSPSSSPESNEKMNAVMQRISQLSTRNVLIMGDFNYSQIDWENGIVDGPEDSGQSRFLETIHDLLLFQHVSKPTRFRRGHVPSRLDLVFTNAENMIDEIDIEEPPGKSDHAVLLWYFQFGSAENNTGKSTLKNTRFYQGRL